MVQVKSKYADNKSTAYQRGTRLKRQKYQAVILALPPICKYANYRTLHVNTLEGLEG